MPNTTSKMLIIPQPMEVWNIVDDKILMNDAGKVNKHYRPALVICHKELIKRCSDIINIIPLTTSAKPDLYNFPVPPRTYSHISETFKCSEASTAILPLYQPIRIQFFQNRLGILNEITYDAIVHSFSMCILGSIPFDLQP